MNSSSHYNSGVITAVASPALKIRMVIKKMSFLLQTTSAVGGRVSLWIGFFICMVGWLTAAQQ